MPEHRARRTVILDLDGTISDPSEGIWRSVNHALDVFDHAPVQRDDVAALIGPPLDQTFRRLVPDCSQAHAVALVASFRERYADIGYSENTLYPHMPDVLRELASTCTLALCTGKRVDFAHKILDMFGLADLFSVVDGGDVGIHKTQQTERMARQHQLSEPVMVGDRDNDIAAGAHIGATTIGVLWGFGDAAELAGANHLATHPADLLKYYRSTQE